MLRNPPKKLLQHSGTKYWRITAGKGKEEQSTITSPGQHCSAPRGNYPIRKNFPCQKSESQVNNWLPWAFEVSHEDLLWFYSIWRPEQLRHIELSWKKEEKQPSINIHFEM